MCFKNQSNQAKGESPAVEMTEVLKILQGGYSVQETEEAVSSTSLDDHHLAVNSD